MRESAARCSGSHSRRTPPGRSPRPRHRLRSMRLALLLSLACACPRSSSSVPERWPRPAVVFLGDSLTEGQGVAREESYPALLEVHMRAQGFVFPIVNAGVSG